ncbi:MAG: hypothetical protein K2Q24_13750 [Chitinophagaceae bacterium]|jgi:hypothetical protein|nr:hypothetical protein [Chitinophagaceae bacterium]
MKKTMKSAAIGFLTLIASVTTFTASAGDPELKAAGKNKNQPVFQLDLNNHVNSKFMIIVKDEFGVTLYQEVVTGVQISRKFQLNTDELGGVGINFEIIDVKNDKTSVFQIQNSTRIVNETYIVKN